MTTAISIYVCVKQCVSRAIHVYTMTLFLFVVQILTNLTHNSADDKCDIHY